MCLTMIYPATSCFEIVALTNIELLYVREKDNKTITEVRIDKSSKSVARLFNKSWLSRYLCACSIIYNNGSEFKLFFENFCDSFGLTRKRTKIRNPQANAVLERIQQVATHLIRTPS